jgi:peptidoglycan L-alanyl-D-glutamate endopeptidase CwlK
MKNTDKITLDRIRTAHPIIREKLLSEYIEISAKMEGVCRVRFAYVYRTPEEQRKLFRQRPKVTGADAWQSIHNYRLAFDIVLLYDNDKNGTFEEASWSLKKDFDGNGVPEWMEVTNFFKSKGYEWGGDWAKFKDAPHFQMAFGLTWQKMKALWDSGKVFVENGIKYIQI